MKFSRAIADVCRYGLLALVCGALSGALPCAASEALAFEKLYRSNGVRGLQFSERALSLKGQRVTMRGYMAPPLKPESRFFVLTRQPVAVCPFCSSDAEWPIDIVVVYLRENLSPTNFSDQVEVEGTLELGSMIDAQTGFVSQARIVAADFRRL